ncbi:MAG: NOB1 family endonuclease [Thermoplasmata archaeon]
MKVVVDTSSFFSGFLPDGSNDYLTAESVLREIRGRGMRESIEMRINFLTVTEPSEETRRRVRQTASRTGEETELSATDIDVVALALENEAIVLTNDLAVQNVCRLLGLKYESFKGKVIGDEIRWGYRCTGCGRRYSSNLRLCPHCGSELKRYPRRKRKIT